VAGAAQLAMRKTVIFGNGLGMSVEPDAFRLDTALGRAWNSEFIDDAQRNLILACLPEGTAIPNAEENMGKLQGIVAACEQIMVVERRTGGLGWLTEVGKNFPEAVYRYVFETSAAIFLASYSTGAQKGTPCALPTQFVDALADFTSKTKPHVATLNYDGLLSRAFQDRGLLDVSNAPLLDGFKDGVFNRRNMFRSDSKNSAWYMHLHGCPLFTDDRFDGEIKKLSPTSLHGKRRINLRRVGRHIVLTHAENKMTTISSSEILRTYWEFLTRAIAETQELIVFGYSGNDLHLNRLISQKREDKTVRVIEWIGAGPQEERAEFWGATLGGDITLHSQENPLAFSDW
jgi:hypothetical protein